jgi:CVNH domain-containing protein
MQLRFAAFAAVAGSLFLAVPALAEAPPPGSYQNSCVNALVQKLPGGPGKNLMASCQKQNGKYVGAMLPLPCVGDIMNKNGELVCKSGRPNPFAPPAGSYTQSCKNAMMMGPILKASCKDQSGNRVETSLNTLECKGRDISVNKNGKLVCR